MRFYLIPRIGDGSKSNPYRPKYVWQYGIDYIAEYYGLEPVYFVGAEVTQEQHEQLSAEIDVLSVPADLDGNISTVALATIQDTLEGLNLPGNLLTTSNTYRQACRLSLVLCKFMTRYWALFSQQLFIDDVNLDKKWAQISVVKRNNLKATADSFTIAEDGFVLDTSFITSQTTIRELFVALYEQWPAFDFGTEVF